MERDDASEQTVETKNEATDRKEDVMKHRETTERTDETMDTNIGSKDLITNNQQNITSSGNVERLENNIDVSDIQCDLDIEDSDAFQTTDCKYGTGVGSCKVCCSLAVLLTSLSGLLTIVGLCFHLYGFSSLYWRDNSVSGDHFGLWKYCNGTCYRIDTYNNWYFGVQACAVMGVSWSIISGVLSIHGLVKGNTRSYVLSLFFYFWACACVLATSVLFVYRTLRGYSISTSFGVYIAGAILQLTAVVISIVNVGFRSTLRLMMCKNRGRRKHYQQKQSDKEGTTTLLDSDS